MAPKKKDGKGDPQERPILGRFRTNLKMGIVGLPNVGKSTIFNAITEIGIPAENFPFCTIDPNHARVHIPDERFTWLVEVYKPKNQVPAFLEIVDIAGLVRGASSGDGLGNAFLSNISAVDGIYHVCRAFDEADVIHVEDRVNPVEDIEIIAQELRLKDIERLDKEIESLHSALKRGNKKEHVEELETCEKVREQLNNGLDVRFGDWNLRETEVLNTLMLLSAKPVVYLINLSEKDYMRKKNKWLPKLAEWVQAHGSDPIIPFSGAYETRLLDMPEDERAVHEKNAPSALKKIITTGFKAVHLIYFFTAGEDEVKCWQIRRGTKAPQAAGTIHTDFERGFICAEVMKYDELKELGSEHAVKAAGKYRQEGKHYEVHDGDVIFFKFNVTSSGKK